VSGDEPHADAAGGPWPRGGTGRGDGIGRGRVRRTAALVGVAARTAGEAVVAGLRGKLAGADGAEFHARTAERYAELLGRSKGALMKKLVASGQSGPTQFGLGVVLSANGDTALIGGPGNAEGAVDGSAPHGYSRARAQPGPSRPS
jgi:hypothetical protein